jgi:hypothetical protein
MWKMIIDKKKILNLVNQTVHTNLIHTMDKGIAKALSGGRRKKESSL